MKPSLYLETTILSYLAARTSSNLIIAGRQAVTQDFWDGERHKHDLYVSFFVYEECRKGDLNVAKKRLELLKNIEVLENTPAVEPLADVYMRLLSIPKNKKIDALHLAICCIHDIDILLSWNCAHLGSNSMLLAKKHNDVHGLSTPLMITPDALVGKYEEVKFDE
jgi:predicted nucleic acid-binding protein